MDEVRADTSILVNIAPPLPNLFVQFPLRVSGVLSTDLGIHLNYRRVSDKESGVEWLLDATLWLEPAVHQVIGSVPVFTWLLSVDENGKCINQIDMHPNEAFFNMPHIKDRERTIAHYQKLLAAALFVVNLMHCKNVIVEPQPVSKREARKAEKQNRPAFRYHLLKVRSSRKMYTITGRRDVEYSTHICRGHFKTFTDDAPLFGRFVGTYWWEAQVRGRDKSHTVDKDYEV